MNDIKIFIDFIEKLERFTKIKHNHKFGQIKNKNYKRIRGRFCIRSSSLELVHFRPKVW